MSDDSTFEFRVKALEVLSERNSITHDKFYKTLEDINKGLAVQEKVNEQILDGIRDIKNQQNTELKELDERLKVIESKPNKRLEGIISNIITFLISAILTYVVAVVGLKM